MQKFETLRQPLLGELAMSRKKERKREREKERKKEEEKMPFIVATNVYACSQGQCMHSARTKIQMMTKLLERWSAPYFYADCLLESCSPLCPS